MTSSNVIAEFHQASLGKGWQVAQQFADLHSEALREFSLAVEQDGPHKRAVVVLGSHSLNIYTAAVDLLILGKFDVAAYLMRPLFDTHGLLLAAAHDEERAKQLLPGGDGLRPSAARKFLEEDPRFAEALSLEQGLYPYMNEYSHANPYHAESLLDITDDGIFPTVGGRADELRVNRDTSIVCGLERNILLTLGQQLADDGSEGWWERFGRSVLCYNEWFKVVSANLAERNARMERGNS